MSRVTLRAKEVERIISPRQHNHGMLRNVESIIDNHLVAEDGYAGNLQDIVVNASDMRISEIVARVGRWWKKRLLRLPGAVLRRPVGSTGMLPIAMNGEQVRECPEISGDSPATRGPDEALSVVGSSPEKRPSAGLVRWSNIRDHEVHSQDGLVGHLRDLIVSDETWDVRYLVIELSLGDVAHTALVPSDWVLSLHDARSGVLLNLTASVLESSPSYETGITVSKDMEENLINYYGQPAES